MVYNFQKDDTYKLLAAYDKKMSLADLLYLAQNVLNYKDIAPFHREFVDFIVSREKKKKLGLLPRGHLKTSLGSITNSIWTLLNDKRKRILIASFNWDYARKVLSEIRGKFESDRFMELFGDMRGSPWNDDEIRLSGVERRKEPSITTTGLERTITGMHFDLIILDDIVSRENIGTMEQIEKAKMYYRDILDILEPNGEILILGTRWHFFDLYGWICNPESGLEKDFQIITRQITEDGRFIYPNKFNREVLDTLIRNKTEYEVSCQYFNNPVPDEERIFKVKNVMNYWRGELDPRRYVFVAIDPASSKKKDSDYTGIVVVAAEPNRKLKVLEAIQKKLNTGERVNEYLRIIEKYRPNLKKFGIEKTGFQESDIFFLQQKLNENPENRFFITELIPKQQSKLSRIEALQPFFERGDIQILPEHSVLQKQLLDFPKCDKFDVADALAYILEMVYYPYVDNEKDNQCDEDERVPATVWTKNFVDREYNATNKFRERHPFTSMTTAEIMRVIRGEENYE